MQAIRLIYEKFYLALFHALAWFYCFAHGGVSVGAGVRFKGMPLVDVREGAILEIGDGTTINSRNFGYHLNMYRRVKLFADRPGARIRIGRNCRIHGSALHAQKSISIGDNCLLAANCQIIDGNGHDLCLENPERRLESHGDASPVFIGDNVWLGEGVLVLPGVTIGEGAVVAAHSVVSRDVPSRCVAAGTPARPLSKS